MYLDPTQLSGLVLILGWLVLTLFVAYAGLSRPWGFHSGVPLSRIWPAFVVGMLLVWLLKAGLYQGLEVHLLGLTALTLIFGVRLAILGVVAVYLLLACSGKLDWSVLGLNAILVGILPILLAAQIYRLAYRYLPHNFFVFVFVSSFLNAALVMAFTMGLLGGFLLLTSGYAADLVGSQFLLITPMLVFPEAFINGGLMSILAIYRPQWVLGYNQDRYLQN